MSKRLKAIELKQLLGSVGIVGTGRVGSALARLLVEHQVLCLVYDSGAGKAEAIANEIGAEAVEEPGGMVGRVQSVFLTTPDDQIELVASGLSEAGLSAAFAAHMSGSQPSTILKGLAERGAAIASIHPVQTFRGDAEDWKLFTGCTFAVEGDAKGVQIARRFVDLLNGAILKIETDRKALYHAMCSVSSNYLVSLWNLAERIGFSAGLTPGEIRKALLPLAEQTMRNLAASGPLLSLTGPIARGDVETVRRQVDAINAGIGLPDRSLFAELAFATADLARDAGFLTEEQLAAMRRVLDRIELEEFGAEPGDMFQAELDSGDEDDSLTPLGKGQ